MSFISQSKHKKIVYSLIFIGVVFLLIYFGRYFRALFTSADAIQAQILQFGRAAPLALIVIEAVQVALAPLNNFITNFAAGYLFGPYLGGLYSYVGWIMGALMVFWLCRLFGRNFVNLFFNEAKLAKFDRLVNESHLVVFVLFLLPGPPDDLIVYLLGLSTGISFRAFALMIVVSKFPGKLATAFLGAGLANHSQVALVIYAVFIAISLVVYWKKPELWRLWRRL